MAKSKLSWFKHYNSSSDGSSIDRLIADRDYETIAFYWWLLEQVSKFEELEKRGFCTLNFSQIARKWGKNRPTIVKLLSKIDQTFKIKVEAKLDESIEVFVPNWLELQENRGVKKSKKIDKNPLEDRREKREDRREIVENEEAVADAPDNIFPLIKENRPNESEKPEINQGPEILSNLWNQHSGDLPKVRELDEKRKKHAKARWKECSDEQTWISIIQALANNSWFNGKTNKSSWRADFDYFIKPSTRIKFIEGTFGNKQKTIRYSP